MPEHEFQANSGRQVRCFNNKKKVKQIIIGSVDKWEGGLSRVTGSKKRNPSSWTVQVQSSNVQVQPMSKSIAALQKSTVIECPKSYRNRSNGMVK